MPLFFFFNDWQLLWPLCVCRQGYEDEVGFSVLLTVWLVLLGEISVRLRCRNLPIDQWRHCLDPENKTQFCSLERSPLLPIFFRADTTNFCKYFVGIFEHIFCVVNVYQRFGENFEGSIIIVFRLSNQNFFFLKTRISDLWSASKCWSQIIPDFFLFN